jgi:hypothetical protein
MVGLAWGVQHLSFSHRATTAMKLLDPHLKDGVHEWRDGKRFVKEGTKLYLEGTDTLAGRYVPRITCAICADCQTP